MTITICMGGCCNSALREEVSTRFVIREDKYLELPNDLALIPGVVNQCLLNAGQRVVDLDPLKMGLQELLVNAMEHGNLGITTAEKQAAQAQGDYYGYTRGRAAQAEYRDRLVRVRVTMGKSRLTISVADMGEGFDWQAAVCQPLDYSKGCGMGLYIVHKVFDEVCFNSRGNKVTVVKYLADRQTRCAGY